MASMDTRRRVVDTISPIHKEHGLWQANDNVLGASWIVAFGENDIEQLIARRHDGEQWKSYKPSARARICEIDDNGIVDVEAVVASFHDSRHGVAPPCFLRIGPYFIYRNVSGYSVPVPEDVAKRIMEANGIKE
jgi:hypothetical protein